MSESVYLVMATSPGLDKPLPLRVFPDAGKAEAWLDKLLDYHVVPPELTGIGEDGGWALYKQHFEDWRSAHPGGYAASVYHRFGVYEVPYTASVDVL